MEQETHRPKKQGKLEDESILCKLDWPSVPSRPDRGVLDRFWDGTVGIFSDQTVRFRSEDLGRDRRRDRKTFKKLNRTVPSHLDRKVWLPKVTYSMYM